MRAPKLIAAPGATSAKAGPVSKNTQQPTKPCMHYKKSALPLVFLQQHIQLQFSIQNAVNPVLHSIHKIQEHLLKKQNTHGKI